MESTAKKLSLSFQTILVWITILPMSFTSKDLSKNDNSEMFFEGQSFLQYNMTEMSNSETLGTDCQTHVQLWFKPTHRQGILVVFSSDSGTWTGIGLKDGYLRTFVSNQTNQSLSVIYGEAITKVTMNKWLDLSIRIHNTKISYSGQGELNNFTGTLNHVTGIANVYVGGVPVVWKSEGKSFQTFTGFIKELLVVCKTNDSNSAVVSSAVKSATFRCLGTCNFSRTRTTNRGKVISQSSLSTSRKSPPTAYTTDIVLRKSNRINAASTTQRSGFLNNSLEVNNIDIVMTNSKRSPPQSTAKASGIAKIYQVTVILIIFLFAAVSLYVLGMIVKNKVQQYRAKLREEQQLNIDTGSNKCLAGRGAEDRNSFTSNLCDIETVTNINEQQTNRFWRERGARLKVHQGNQLRMSASTQSLMSNLNDMESAANQVKFWREGGKKANQVRMSASTYSLSSRRSSAPVCESSLFVTPRPLRKREGTSSSKDIPRVVLTSACAQDDKITIKRGNPIKNIHGRATNTLININGKIPVKGMEERYNEEGGHKGEGKCKSFKNADKMPGFALNPKENTGNMSYKWAYIRPDSETECSENERMRQSSKTNRFFDTSFRPCSLRILETNESEEEDEIYDNKDKNCDEFQTFRCRSSDNICRGGERMKISYDPCLSSSQSERLVCFGIHSASSDPSVVSSSGGNLMCDCSIQQRLHSSYHDTASGPELESQHLDAFLDSFLYNKSCPVDLKNENCTSYVQENDVLHSRQPKLDNNQSFLKTNETYIKLLTDSKDLDVPKIPSSPPPPPLPPSSLQLQQKKRQQLQLDQLPSFLISKEILSQNNQEKNINGQRGRLLREPKFDLPNPRPHSSCNFTRTDDVDEDLYHPIRMTHASSCDSIPQWVVTPSSSKNSNESVEDSACGRQNIFSSQQGVNQTKTQECGKPISRDADVANSNGLDNSAQQAKVSNQQVARKTNNQTLKKLMPDSSRDVPVASSSNGFKNPWILRPNVLSKKNEHAIQRKPVLQTKHQVSRWNPRQIKPKSSLSVNNKDGEGGGEKKVLRRSSWASGNRPSEFELALKGTVPVKRPPSNASVLLKVPGSRTRPQSETMF